MRLVAGNGSFNEHMLEVFRNLRKNRSRSSDGNSIPMDGPSDLEENARMAHRMVVFGIFLSILVILFNLILVYIILSSKELRRKPFFWNIISLCISDLVVGAFVIPIGLDYMTDDTWSFGHDLCKIWSITDTCHFSLSALILVTICLDRLLAKLQSVTPINQTTTKMVSIALTALPWFFLLVVCIPIMVIGERNLHEEFNMPHE